MSVVATPPPGVGVLILALTLGAQTYGENERDQPGMSAELPTKSGMPGDGTGVGFCADEDADCGGCAI